MAASIAALPASLKPIQHYLKIANEHDARDPVVAYFCWYTMFGTNFSVSFLYYSDNNKPFSNNFMGDNM